MTDHSAIEAATRRLQAALDMLESAVEARLEATARSGTLADQLHLLESDRAKLAADLDHAAARSKSLESTNREIAQRLDSAMESIRSVITVQNG
jgi:septation ring formation regulator EzrA